MADKKATQEKIEDTTKDVGTTIEEKLKADVIEVVETAEEKEARELAEAMAALEEEVPFYAMKDNGRYKDDIFVAVNGETLVIQRGVHVKIKRKFFNVLVQAEEQDTKTSMMIEGFQSKYKSSSKELT